MEPSVLFKIANPVATIGWILLAFLPNSKVTEKVVKSGYLSLFFSVSYFICIIITFSGPRSGGGFDSLEGVRALFMKDWALLAGWIHYLAFDLLAGVQVNDTLKSRNHFIRIFCLFFTLMFGPIGWGLSKIIGSGKQND